MRELARTTLPCGPGSEAAVAAEEVEALPAAVRRYIHFMGVVGRPRVWSLRAEWRGAFRMKPSGPWHRCECWQYNTRLELARLFRMCLHINPVLPIYVRDDYMRGAGHMCGKLLNVVPLADASTEEIAIGELVTYLNDAILLAPSMLLGPEVAWTSADPRTFDVALTDAGRTVQARVFLDDRGAPTDFQTTDRFYQSPTDDAQRWVRTPWRTPIDDFEVTDGRARPTRGRAIWQLPEGPFAYADLRLLSGTLVENVAPGE